MNHPEFSNNENSEFLRRKDGLLALFRYAQKSPLKVIYWGDVVFCLKIEDF